MGAVARGGGRADELRLELDPADHVRGAGPEIAQVGGQVVLSIDVTNVGGQDIPQLTLIVNDAYIAGMSVQDTSPDSIRHNEQGGEYFIFGALPRGTTGHYIVRMTPLSAGELTATIDVARSIFT